MAIWRALMVAAAVAMPGAVLAQSNQEQAAGAALEDLHAAAARADATAYFDRLDPDLTWIGNDITERWTRDGFIEFAEPYFARGEGWTYAARDRRVILAPDPCECLAWADEVLDSATYGTAVGNAVIRRGEDGEWRVWRYALTYPIPNDLARGMTEEIQAWEAANPQSPGPPDGRQPPAVAEIGALLDGLHTAAAEADGETYFGLFTPDALYRGTDVTELWTVEEFRAYAEPYFNQGRGWTYVPRLRRVDIAPTDCACVAWFDEILESESYGTSRGTGVVVRGEDGMWRIAYYALTFPIPNALARDMTARIRVAAPGETTS